MRLCFYLKICLVNLKVNFQKSELVGVNVSRSWLLEATIVLNCKVSALPIVEFLGPCCESYQISSVWLEE